jgi:hypothetical protein
MNIKESRANLAEEYVRMRVKEGKSFVNTWELQEILGLSRMQTGVALHDVHNRGIPGIDMELWSKGTWVVRMSDDQSVRSL